MQERSEMQQRQGYQAVEKLRETLDEKYLWEVILLYAGESFKTYTGLPFTYEVRKGRNGDYTRELWIDRRENSKSLALSSVLLALRNIKKVGAVVDRPKALGDIRGVSYIYGMFYRFGLIDVGEVFFKIGIVKGDKSFDLDVTEPQLQEAVKTMQMNQKDAVAHIRGSVKDNTVLIFLNAVDSRTAVKKEAETKAKSLEELEESAGDA